MLWKQHTKFHQDRLRLPKTKDVKNLVNKIVVVNVFTKIKNRSRQKYQNLVKQKVDV